MVEFNFEAGDKVHFRLALEELTGRVLDSPDSEIVLVKLDSGYNIGLKKENILGCEVIEKYCEVKLQTPAKQNPNLPKIGLVITGGTIASKSSQATGGVKPITDVNEFLKFYPELLNIVNVKKLEVPFKIFSENMSSEHWIKIAEVVKSLLDDSEIEGVIVSHGTDTLHYTSAALSFFLSDLNKPVVLTYSQRSIDRASSDANLNLQCAAKMAISDCAEVVLVGHASTNDDYCYALAGNKARKMHSSRRDAFQAINSEPIAKITPEKIEFLSSYKKRDNNRKTQLDIAYTDKIALIKFYPGQTPDILDFLALKYKGVIIEGSGMGHVTGSAGINSWIPTLKKHIRNGFVVCITTQTINGRVDPYVYSTAREMMDAGCIFLEDMLSETALVKLGWVLGHYGWKKYVKEKMLENINGEFEDKLPV